jgi:hypothetical protein
MLSKVIKAEPPELPIIQTSQIQGVADPPVFYSSKQIPYLQLTRLLDQLSEFASFSNELFASIFN